MQDAGYAQDVEDIVWIPEVAAEGWIILTKDRNIRRDTLELQVTLNANAKLFTLGKGHYSAAQIAEIFLHHRVTIERVCAHRKPPIVGHVNRSELRLRSPDGEMQLVKRKGKGGG